MEFFIAVVLILLALAFFVWRTLKSTTVYDYQKGLLFRRGHFEKELGPGRYRYWPSRTQINVFDLRLQPLLLPGQEILTADKINVRLTLAGSYRIVDPRQALLRSTAYMSDLYTSAQLVLREIVGRLTLEELLEKKAALDEELLATVSTKAKDYGLELSGLAVRDIMLPANLKKAFAGALEAQKEAQRLLEKARGEQAVLRSLANSSKMYRENPSLLQARVIQALESGGNTVVFGSEGIVTTKQRSVKG